MTLPVEQWFERAGGEFVTSPDELRDRLTRVRAFLFDWDGVFNPGIKSEAAPSSWSEADSMGQNLLRFGWWMDHDRTLPPTAILTGQHNPAAVQLAQRERFQAVYQGFIDKRIALEHFLQLHRLDAGQVAFVFDDALDLSVAERVGARFLVRRGASPLFRRHVVQTGACDYVTGMEGGEHAVREVAELVLGLRGLHDRAVQERMAFGDEYSTYLAQRQVQQVRMFRRSDDGVTEG